MSTAPPVAAWRARLDSACAVLRRVIGVPDYDTYVAHMQAAHPGAQLLTRDDFARERMQDRYNRPGNRCC